MTIEHRCVSDLRPVSAVVPLPPLVHVPA